MTLKTFFIITSIVVSTMVCLNIFVKNPDVKKPVKCNALTGYISTTQDRNSSETNFILVLRDDKNRVFDCEVTPSAYYLASKNKTITLMLTQRDIVKNSSMNVHDYSNIFQILLGIVWFFMLFYIWIFQND